MMTRLTIIFFLAVLVATGFAENSNDGSKFDIESLDGEWAGFGEAIIPITQIPLLIEGKAYFSYDSTLDYLRTSIVAQKYFFTYSDSGHLYHDPKTDSVIWEIWDGFGKYGKYFGEVKNGVLTGTLYEDQKRYNIAIDFITADSLTFNLTSQKREGKVMPEAKISLWRVKD